MKEDIIILENAIKYSEKQFEELGEYTYLDKDIMQAIENIIKRNKELEEKINKEIEKLNENLKYETNRRIISNIQYTIDTLEYLLKE
jgi:hypothetical protein